MTTEGIAIRFNSIAVRRWRFPALLVGASCAFSLGCSDGGVSEVMGSGGTPNGAGGDVNAAGGSSDGSGGAIVGSGGASNSGGTNAGGAPTSTGGSTGSGGELGASGGQAASGGAEGDGDVMRSAGCDTERTLQNGTRTIQSGGVSRSYRLNIPDDYDSSRAYRFILGFHGATGSGGDVAPSYFGLWDLAEGSTIFVAPDAVGGLWNATADATFVDDILAEIESDLCIDTTRVQLEGFSQGGAMAWTLACARPGVFRAAVVHSGGGLPRPASCEPIAFMSSLGQSESSGAGQTSNSDFFAGQNGCTVEPLMKAPSGGHACSDYAACSDGHPTRWCDYDGGHTPSPNDQGKNMSWMPQEVWNFLKQF